MASFDEAVHVEVSGTYLTVRLRDGRCVHVPTRWFPTLVMATQAQRDGWELVAGGTSIRWPTVDEDVSVARLLRTT